MNTLIPLSVPNIKGNEKKYVNEALDQEWVSSAGPHILQFENMFEAYLEADNACACQSGTAGLHLCLIAMDIHEDDIVLVPTLTFIATINAVRYQKATPVFFDCDDSLCINTKFVQDYLENDCIIQDGITKERQSGKIVKAIIPVHVFGNMCDMEKIMDLAVKYHLKVIEDATEALGSFYLEGKYKGKKAGTIGTAGVFSFNGNKIITTGGGGMVVSNDRNLIERMKYLSTQSKNDSVYFIHNEIGYNYRLTNVQAAIGLGQMECLEKFIQVKKTNYLAYKHMIVHSNLGRLLEFRSDIRPNYWFYSFVLNERSPKIRDELIHYLDNHGIQTRPIWKLNHTQKPYLNFKMIGGSVAEQYYDSIINLPCSSNLSKHQLEAVVQTIQKFFNNQKNES